MSSSGKVPTHPLPSPCHSCLLPPKEPLPLLSCLDSCTSCPHYTWEEAIEGSGNHTEFWEVARSSHSRGWYFQKLRGAVASGREPQGAVSCTRDHSELGEGAAPAGRLWVHPGACTPVLADTLGSPHHRKETCSWDPEHYSFSGWSKYLFVRPPHSQERKPQRPRSPSRIHFRKQMCFWPRDLTFFT